MVQHVRKLFVLIVALTIATPVAAGERVTVVELFTSQSCSACPPADALLRDLVQYPHLLPLSEHVDYWDYLGWRDPFAHPDLTRRQRQYAQQLGLSYVYTPQFVIQGTVQAAGRDRDSILRQINEMQALSAPAVVDILRAEDGQLAVRLEQMALPSAADVWLVHYLPARTTAVAHGENSGRSIENINVVRHLTLLDRWSGEPKTVPLSRELPTDGHFAVLVQQSNSGPIIGAARLPAPAR
jgi:hypothetical protein